MEQKTPVELIDSSSKLTVVTNGSNDGKFRFTLEKEWDATKRKALFILLNPSKGTELKLDNSICNIMNYSVEQGFGGFRLVNLFPLMATTTRELTGKLALGKKENDDAIRKSINWADVIYVAWGSGQNYITRKREVENFLSELASQKKVLCWKDPNGNYPRHLRILGKNWSLESYVPKFSKNT
ncbi:DUF1643 domain-containing protein [Vibrio antiquarius]